MRESGKFSDMFNSLNGNMELRISVLESSNELKKMGVSSPGQIKRIYKSGDFIAFHDPLKVKNLEMFGIDNKLADQIIVAEVTDLRKGYNVYQFINTGDTPAMKRGDILTLDPTQEGKEEGTRFQESFKEYCISIVKLEIPNIEHVASSDDVMKALGLRTYEDVVYMSAKSGGLKEGILSQLRAPENKAKFVQNLNTDKEDLVEQPKGEQQEPQQEPQQEENGMTVAEAAIVLGVSVEVIRQAVGDNAKILGINITDDVSALAKQLGVSLDNATPEVILLKTAGPGIKAQGFVLNKDGSPLITPNDADTTLIPELVADGASGDNIDNINEAIQQRDVESKKVETSDPITGKPDVRFVEEGTPENVNEYERMCQKVLAQLEERIKTIEEGPGDDSEKLNLKASVMMIARNQLFELQKMYHVTDEHVLDTLETGANEAGMESIGAGAADVVAEVAKKFGEQIFPGESPEDGRDPREADHSEGRIIKYYNPQ